MYREQAPDEEQPAVRWLPFQLNPDLPEEGISRQAYIERKFGPGGARNYSRVAGVGKEVGIDFAFDNIKVQPNTVNAHRLMHYAEKHGRGDEVAEVLFQAYFIEGANLTDRDIILQGDIEARRAGINGVPYFIFNRRIAVSGAHEAQTLLGAMMEALKEPAATK